MEIISLCFERVTPLGFLACHHTWRKMADGQAATVHNIFHKIIKCVCQIVSMECLSPLLSSPVCSCSHDLTNTMMSTKKHMPQKLSNFSRLFQTFLFLFLFYCLIWKWKHFVSKLCSSCRQMNKVYKKYNFCILSLNMTGATIFFIVSHWKPEISLAVVVAHTLGCAGSEQVKNTPLPPTPPFPLCFHVMNPYLRTTPLPKLLTFRVVLIYKTKGSSLVLYYQ